MGSFHLAIMVLAAASAANLRGNATVGVDYPVSGTNSLAAGGGGKCTYHYTTHDSMPVVTSAGCKQRPATIFERFLGNDEKSLFARLQDLQGGPHQRVPRGGVSRTTTPVRVY